ncbi:hypothetical protein P152DRAFT_113110 [Eremomyces bilateralis CBS 781.70]|uniref:Xylanolytic transcriptional activator regulatory domain-containing protein n=1 Tax=Eremomyces bilateralis CBS 781.70 TaxID=1392243 RepID=A0A6G1GDT4_9PEZI|nr:uncharacterized protein P152DRAFT_113110 [Eremomyces bilateralis CBS 781.70]KAF1816174.1 hypothetical protein P152DRAFT_113110 [Eremomyces bilateralis CBS 781.70]
MRCDPNTSGCQNCLDVGTQCLTTDRITGRAWIRGIGDKLEEENRILKSRIVQYETRLRDLGEDVPPLMIDIGHPVLAALPSQPTTTLGAPTSDWSSNPQGDPLASGSYPHPSFDTSVLPALKQGKGNNYFGVTSSSTLSTIKGTSLSFFSIEVDIADFIQDDPVEQSYDFFLKGVFGLEKHEKPQMISVESSRMCAEGFFRAVNPFAPILHKPDFMRLLDRIHSDENVELKPSEIVSYHMMIASLKFQQSLRNGDKNDLKESHAHYAYSLGFVSQLVGATEISGVAALCMICFYLRNLPKPGPAWLMANWTYSIAIELGVHRSAKAWGECERKLDSNEIEMGKRVWWSLYALLVALSGRLGRPMPLRDEDFDCEIPEPLHDNLPNEDLPEDRKCSFRVGIVTFKIASLMAKVFTTIYALRPPNYNYEQTVLALEMELDRIKNELHPTLHPDKAVEEDRVFATYCQLWDAETRLLIRHPARCASMDSKYITNNLQVCLTTANTLLDVIWTMHELRSLDVVWIAVTSYLSGLFTALFVYSQRTEDIRNDEYDQLRSNMERWLYMVGEIGKMLEKVHPNKTEGTYPPMRIPPVETSAEKLQKTIKGIIHGILKQIHDRFNNKHQLEVIARDAQTQAQAEAEAARTDAQLPTENNSATGTKYVPSAAPYTPYPDPSVSLGVSSAGYPSTTTNYPISPYQNPAPPVDTAPPPPPNGPPQMSLAEALGSYTSGANGPPNNMGSAMWDNFTNTAFAPNMGNEYLSSANALMNLGARQMPNGTTGPTGPTWPQNVYRHDE